MNKKMHDKIKKNHFKQEVVDQPNQPNNLNFFERSFKIVTTNSSLCEQFLKNKYVLLIVDAEEIFDWHKDFPTQYNESDVDYILQIKRFLTLCKKYKIIPLFLLTYPMLKSVKVTNYLQDLFNKGQILCGIHQHPWLCPPFLEEKNSNNSFPSNIGKNIKEAKLVGLINAFKQVFGEAPKSYKAGRYGVNHDCFLLLKKHAIEIDHSIAPAFNYGNIGGEDFSHMSSQSQWILPDLLSLPTTSGFCGWAHRVGAGFHQFGTSSWGRKLRTNALASFINAYARVRLSPEGYNKFYLHKYIKHCIAVGQRVLTVSLHAPSLVKHKYNQINDVDTLYNRLDFILRELIINNNFLPSNPQSVYQLLQNISGKDSQVKQNKSNIVAFYHLR